MSNETLSRTVNINYNERQFAINYPTVKNFIDIECKKALLSNGQYSDLINQKTIASIAALDYVDAMAHLIVLSPQLMKSVKVPLQDLSIDDAMPLIDQYKIKIVPWLSKWSEFIANTILPNESTN